MAINLVSSLHTITIKEIMLIISQVDFTASTISASDFFPTRFFFTTVIYEIEKKNL